MKKGLTIWVWVFRKQTAFDQLKQMLGESSQSLPVLLKLLIPPPSSKKGQDMTPWTKIPNNLEKRLYIFSSVVLNQQENLHNKLISTPHLSISSYYCTWHPWDLAILNICRTFNNQNLNFRLTQVNFGMQLELHEVFRTQKQSSLTLKGKTTQATRKRKKKEKKKKNNPPPNKITLNHQRNHKSTAGLVETKELLPTSPVKCFPFSLPSSDHLSKGDTAFQEWKSIFVSSLWCYPWPT